MNSTITWVLFFWCAPVLLACGEHSLSFHHGSHTEQVKEERPDLTVAGSVRLADGIGRQAVDLIESLKDSATISFVATIPVPDEEFHSCHSSLRKILSTSGVKYPGKVLIYEDLLAWMPTNNKPKGPFWSRFKLPENLNDQIRIAYTMFESSRLPKAWAYILNHSFDAVVVPDEFLVKVCQDSGVDIPIFVIPLGRDLKAFLEAPLKKSRGTPFVFANYSTCFPRKNLLTLVRAFSDAFQNSPDVQLQLCWRTYNGKTREAIFSEIAARGLTNVKIEEHAVDDKAYLQRFLMTDCYVNIATGEGFSIPPREAMALGIPVIVTNNTGQKAICSSRLVRVVPSLIKVPAMYTFPGDFGVQYQCRQKDVQKALLDVYRRYDLYVQKGQLARKWASQYHYTQLAPLYMSLIKPKKIVLGEKNAIVQDGIMTTSKKLAAKYKRILQLR